MPRRELLSLRAEHRREVEKILRRHPEKTSICGALLAEILTAKDVKRRWTAAHWFGCLHFRRGLRSIERLIEDLEDRYLDLTRDESNLLSFLIYALGYMDTPDAHAVLTRHLTNSKHAKLRGDVLEAMAFEKECFDLKTVLSFATTKAHRPEVLSALYALEFQNYASHHPKRARKVLAPFLRSKDSRYREYAVSALRWSPKHLDMVLPLKDDPDAYVRQMVEEAIRYSKW